MENDRIIFVYAWNRARKELDIQLPVNDMKELSDILANEFKISFDFPISLRRKFGNDLVEISLNELEDLMEIEFDMVIDDIVHLRLCGSDQFLRCSWLKLSEMNRHEFGQLCGCHSKSDFLLCTRDNLIVENVVDFPSGLQAHKTYYAFQLDAKSHEKVISAGNVSCRVNTASWNYSSVADFTDLAKTQLGLTFPFNSSLNATSMKSTSIAITNLDQIRLSTEISLTIADSIRFQTMIFLYDSSPTVCMGWIDLDNNTLLNAVVEQSKFEGSGIKPLLAVPFHGNLIASCEKLLNAKRIDFERIPEAKMDDQQRSNILYVPFENYGLSLLRDYDLLLFGSVASNSAPLSANIIKWMSLLRNSDTHFEIMLNDKAINDATDDPLLFSLFNDSDCQISLVTVGNQGNINLVNTCTVSIHGRIAQVAETTSPMLRENITTPMTGSHREWKIQLLSMEFRLEVVEEAVRTSDTFEAALNYCFDSSCSSEPEVIVESKQPLADRVHVVQPVIERVHVVQPEDQERLRKRLERELNGIEEIVLHVRSAKPCRIYGTRVKRGRNWKPEYFDQDGGIGHYGTVVPFVDPRTARVDEKTGVCSILWDNKQTNVYACGLHEMFEIEPAIADSKAIFRSALGVDIGSEVVKLQDADRNGRCPIGTAFYASKEKCFFLVSWRNLPGHGNVNDSMSLERYFNHLAVDALPNGYPRVSTIVLAPIH